MELRDLLRRKHESKETSGLSKKNARAVADYERFLATAPQDTIERAHVTAFERLTPEQLDVVYRRFLDTASTEDRPVDRTPTTLARSAAAAEKRTPGYLGRTFATMDPLLDAWLWSSIIETVAITAVSTAVWSTSDDPTTMTGHDDGSFWDAIF
jgi:hypothetical protein